MSDAVAVDVDDSIFEGEAQNPAARKTDGLYIRFHKQLVENKTKSWGGIVYDEDGKERKVKGEGRPIFEEVEYLELIVPGDRTNIPNRPVSDADRRKYARQYKAWKEGEEEATSGTPLSAWPGITRARMEELAFFKVKTVEQLASVSDANLQNMGMGARQERERAKDYLAAAKGNAGTTALRSQLARRESEMDVLKRQNEELLQRVSALEGKKGKKSAEPEESQADDDEAAAAVLAAAEKTTRSRGRKSV